MREYHQYCGIAKALDVVGGRWTLLIVRELLPGPRRYGELRQGLPGITTNLLAQRLKELASHGLVERRVRSTDGRRAWGLTELGRSLKPAVLALGAFGAHWMGTPGNHHTSGRWFLVSLQRRYLGGVEPTVLGLEIDGEPYTARIDLDALTIQDGWPAEPDLTLRGPLPVVARALTVEEGVPDDVEVWGRRSLLPLLRRSLA